MTTSEEAQHGDAARVADASQNMGNSQAVEGLLPGQLVDFAAVAHSPAIFAVLFGERDPFARIPHAAASLRMTPAVFFQVTRAFCDHWNEWVTKLPEAERVYFEAPGPRTGKTQGDRAGIREGEE